MAECVLLKGGGGGIDPDELTAVAGDVLAGKKAGVAGNDEPVTGTMPNQGAKTSALNCGGSYAIPTGYHNGSGKVTANTLASQTSGTATAAQILKSYTAWVNGNKLTGTMIDYSRSPSPIDAIRLANGRFEVAVAKGYHGYSWANNGYEYMSLAQVANVLGLTAAKIKKGQTICGVAGSMVDYSYLAQGHTAFNGSVFSGAFADGMLRWENGANKTHITSGALTGSTIKKNGDVTFKNKTSFNLTPFKSVRITGNVSTARLDTLDLSWACYRVGSTGRGATIFSGDNLSGGNFDSTIDISDYSGEGYISLSLAKDAYQGYAINITIRTIQLIV